MNITRTQQQSMPIMPTPLETGAVGNGAEMSTLNGGSSVTVTENSGGICGDVSNVTDEVEKSLVRDDWLGRAINQHFCYTTPEMPLFSD